MRSMVCLVKISILLSVISLVLCDKLVMIQTVFRHGARYPLQSPISRDSDEYRGQFGQLTPQGRHMSYALGKVMHRKYWKQLFGGTQQEYKYHSSLFQVQSTNFNRTIESAQAFLTGLLEDLQPETLAKDQLKYSVPPFVGHYEPTDSDKWYVFGTNKYYHTLPIHTNPVLESADFKTTYQGRLSSFLKGSLFSMAQDSINCPKQAQWIKENTLSSAYRQIKSYRPLKELFKTLSQEVGYQVNYENAGWLVDELVAARARGKPYLKAFQNPQNALLGQYMLLTDHLRGFHQSIQRRTVSTPFLQKLLSSIKQGLEQGYPRVVVMSGHDTTLLTLLTAFEMCSLECLNEAVLHKKDNSDSCITSFPSFASSLILQLWKREDKTESYYIKVIYNGKARKIPVCEDKIKCPLQEFQRWASGFIVQKYERNCELPQVIIQS